MLASGGRLSRPIASLLGWALLSGCPRPPSPEDLAVSPATAPILPAPEAALYATGDSRPRDALVARAVQNGLLPWQESLSGAATALALDPAIPLELAAARHAAWRAGYPYPVVRIISGEENAGAYPSGLTDTLQRLMQPGDHVGMVRARRASQDLWVALIGRPAGLMEPLARAAPLDDRVSLVADRPATYAIVRPDGRLTRGEAPVEVVLDAPGEWWMQLDTPDGRRIAGVPVYVAMDPPTAPLLDVPGPTPEGPVETAAEAFALVNDIRSAFEAVALAEDGTLQTLARHPLEQVLDGSWDRDAGEARLRGAGFVGGPVAQLWCAATTVESCIDELLADADGRAALLHPQLRLGGAAAQVRTDGVVVLLNLTSE